MNTYINYHKHTHYSNIATPDSVATYDEYVNRINELGYGMLFTTEHGNQSNYLEVYEKAKENNIKFGFGVEAYWVLDNQEKDRTNNHVIILAKSKKGMKAINLLLSNANIDGYYYKPRVDIGGLLNLPKDDVFITTACVAFNGYGEEVSKSIILDLYNHFQDNFMLELQYHHTELQKKWNKFLLEIHNEYGINIIAGMDSHYIYPEQHKERDALLKAKHINYEQEEGWFMDYPSFEEAFKRFEEQGVLSIEEIEIALKNTLILENFNDIDFDKNIKVPNIFPDKTYEERVEHFKNILRDAWDIEKENILIEKRQRYVEEIIKEIEIITKTKMVDYFILNYYVIKKAKELGGRLTLTSRGSAPSFYVNKLLKFTTIDRISSSIQLFPERFMSVSRILKKDGTIGSIPDIDFNTDKPEIFLQAQREILGKNSTYYMIAYGKLKEKSAFKTYARTKDIDFETSNLITKNITEYEFQQKHSDEELNINNFIDSQYIDIYNESKKYQGTIDSASQSPCAVISFDGNVLEDIGVVKLRDSIVTIIDGKYLDKYKYVKNDFLKVNVVDIIFSVFKKANQEPISADKLIKITEGDEKVWSLFWNGITLGLNQVEQDGTKNKCMKYKPTNISELSAFVASIRPGFASMLDKFLNRERFRYNIKDFDNLIQTEQMQDSWLLYQEQIMQTLQYAGFPVDECYSLIKSIAKKVEGVVEKVENKFIKGFMNKGNTEEDAKKIWKVILDNSKYSFNSSHSLSVGLDSLYGAYLKAYYPYEFYQVMLELYTENKDIEKVSALKKEMEYFNIHIGNLEFGLDNTGFVIDKKNNRINQSLNTVKYINSTIPHELNEIYDDSLEFYEILPLIKQTSTNSRQLEVLIKINYFKKYGSIKKLLTFNEWYDKITKRKTFKKENIEVELENYIKGDSDETEKMYKNLNYPIILEKIWNDLSDEEFDDIEIIKFKLEYLGYLDEIPKGLSVAKVEMVSTKYKSVNLKSFRDNQSKWFKFDKLPKKGDVIMFKPSDIKKKTRWKGRKNLIITKYEKIT